LPPTLVGPVLVPQSGLSGLEVELEHSSRITGKVIGLSAEVHEGLSVELSRSLEHPHAVLPISGIGEFGSSTLRPGTWWLTAIGANGTKLHPPKSIQLGPGENKHIELDLLEAHAWVSGGIRIGGRTFAEGIVSEGVSQRRMVSNDWVAELHSISSQGTQRALLDRIAVADDGSFRLGYTSHNSVDLRLLGNAGHRSKWRVEWNALTTTLLAAELRLDIMVGRVEVHAPKMSADELAEIELEWRCPERPGLTVTVVGVYTSEGLLLFPNVPIGTVILHAPALGAAAAGNRREIDVIQDNTTIVEL